MNIMKEQIYSDKFYFLKYLLCKLQMQMMYIQNQVSPLGLKYEINNGNIICIGICKCYFFQNQIFLSTIN